MCWLSAYLLVGFMLSWAGHEIIKIPANPAGWKVELIAVMIWPLTLTMSIIYGYLNRKK